ncbi:leucyl aminopeptidase [Chromatiales bacterium (ex Bugula neritina AB1)]|nr:leucyl aminopeptidase [Chromatiales bacterium (ex Bugula neritina AB1)]
MKISLTNADPVKLKTSCLVLPIGDPKKLTGCARSIDNASSGYITDILKQGDLSAKAGSTLLLHKVPNITAKRLLLVSSGGAPSTNAINFDRMAAAQAKALNQAKVKDATSCLTDIAVDTKPVDWAARSVAREMVINQYHFDQHKSKKADRKPYKLSLHIADKKNNRLAETGAGRGVAIANGMQTTRDLGNMAANFCTPTFLAEHAKTLKKQHASLKVTVLSEAQMEKLKMGSLLSVSAGSAEPAKMICMEYKGGKANQKPIVLVGKGVTFDTGGISMKPSAGMDEMKYDMCGAASVFGVMRAVAELALPVNIVGVVAAAENMPGGRATKPGDIVTSMSGQTIEVLNTDAEGRLVLCDALTYIGKYKPDVVIDIATLTGAVVVALGHHTTGLMSNDDKLANELYDAGIASADKCWRLPLWDEYQKQLSSNFADIPNIGGRAAGSITAGCFLSRFAEDYRWAHLDIAGVAWRQGAAKGATGRPVPLLMEFILNRCT